MCRKKAEAQALRFEKTRLERFTKFYNKANEIHSGVYDYSKVIFERAHTKVIIICKEHGEFLQTPLSHTDKRKGAGCPSCAHTVPLSLDDFQKRSDKKYGNKFKILSFNGIKNPATILCPTHGEFTTMAERHTNKGSKGGCPTCAYVSRLEGLKPGNISKAETSWLDMLNITQRQVPLKFGDKIIYVDGFDPETNTVYEYYGSYWHGDPTMYDPDELNTKIGMTHGEIYERTLRREKLIKTSYNLIVKWAST